MRLEYPASIKIIHVPCSGKVDVLHLLRAIQKGADGAYIVGCLEGSCHFNEGNYRAKERVQYVSSLLEEVGIEGDRVRMYNLTSGEGPTFAAFKYPLSRSSDESAIRPNPMPDWRNIWRRSGRFMITYST